MRYFPAFLNLHRKRCLVVGGGQVAERKVRILLRAGAAVDVIGPRLSSALSLLKARRKIRHRARLYRYGDMREAFLVIAATNNQGTNEGIAQEAEKRKILVNVVDDPGRCNFIVPSRIERGDLLIALSTSGKSPALAKSLRQKLQREIGPEYAFLLRLLGEVRQRILPLGRGQKMNQEIFRWLVGQDFQALIKKKNFRELNRRLRKKLGSEFSLIKLGLKR
jgi:precorrin-2 dehydrogenase/sirohydrochlorin ferrochelatase